MANLDRADTPYGAGEALTAERDLLVYSRGAPSQRSSALAQVIEADIIPRLLIARGGVVPEVAGSRLEADADDIADFAAMMVALDLRKANLVVSGAIGNGVSVESVLLDLLAPTAQRLGQMWVDDDLTFTDVTVGLCTLQNLLRSVTAGDHEPSTVVDGRILIAATPGEQHSFGTLMLETMFRRAGWDTIGMPMSDAREIRSLVSRRDFAIVGFSLSRESAIDELTALIEEVREASRNPRLVVMVGGRVFNENPALVRRVGADMTACDGRAALVASNNVVCSRMRTH